MPRLRFALLAFAIGFSNAAIAQNLSAEQRDACKADYDKYCTATMPGGGRIIACLNKQYGQLADACKKVIDAQKK
jgi:Cysteine rich repeat